MHTKLYAIFLFANVYCFNIDTDFPVIYKDPYGNPESRSYFGYSVVIYPGSNEKPQPWIKIGAPRAGFAHVGTVYNCPLGDYYQGCSNMSFPVAGYSADKAAMEVREGNWIGGAMDISYKYNRMVICGFRRHFHQVTLTRKGTEDVDYRAIGGCYWSNLNTDFFEDIISLKDTLLGQPTITINATTGKMLYYFGQAESGFSAYFSDTEDEFILGAPGSYDYSGSVIKVNEAFYEPPIETRRKRRRAFIPFSLDIAPQDYDVSNHYDLWGYSVTSGHFFGGQKVYYAAGSPKGIKTDQKKGKVLIFDFQGSQHKLLLKESIKGEQLGSYFGSSITSGKINKDEYDDLVIAAPFYREHTYNEGKVYVYLGGKENFIKSTTLTGTTPNGQFGSAVMYIEDIDHDGYGDIAISAPYEEEHGGVVYIFKGQDSGLIEKPSQILKGKQFLPELRGFGISFSRSADMDNNKYKDLAIGSALSGHVVYLRTRPIVIISANLQVIPNILESTDENLSLKACFEFSQFEESLINISFSVKVDRLKLSFTEESFTVFQNNLDCKQYNVSLESNFLDEQEIYASLSYSLLEPPRIKGITIIADEIEAFEDRFCKNCPILDKYRSSPNDTKIKIPVRLDCGEDGICESNLVVTANITEIQENNIFVIGSSEFMTLEILIENTGENAYLTKLEVNLPDELQFTDNANRCKFIKNKSTAICQVDNPLKQYSQKQLTLSIDMRSVNRYSNLQDFVITFSASTVSNDTQTSNIYRYPVSFKYADVTISGWSDQKNYFLENEVKDEIYNITHIYRVGKTGPTTLDKLIVTIEIPHVFNSPNGDVNLLRLHQPYINFKEQLTKCTGDFDLILNEAMGKKTAAYTAEDDSGFFSARKKREMENNQIDLQTNDIDMTGNILFLNCSSENVICSILECPFNLFEDQNDFAEIKIDMEFAPSKIPGINSLDTVLIATNAEVVILSPEHFQQSGNSPDKTVILTPFKKEGLSTVALWIIILAVILGLLLLILIIFGLIKLGFFKREIREELRSLKSQKSVEEQPANQTDDDDNNGDDEELIMEIADDQELHPVDMKDENPDSAEQTEDQPLQSNCNSSTEGLLDDNCDDKS